MWQEVGEDYSAGASSATVDVATVVDPLNQDQGIVVVDAVQDPVGPAARAVQAGQLAAQRLADAAGFARQVAEHELNNGRDHPRGQPVQITARGGGEPNREGHAPASVGAPGNAELGADFVFAVGAPGRDVRVGLGYRSFDPGLGQPVQRLLQRLPLVGTDQHRRRRTILGDRDLILGERDRVDVLVELVLDLRNWQDPHATMIGFNIVPRKAAIKADNIRYGQLAAPNTAAMRHMGSSCS
jgi:hypothetical protein